MSDFRIPYESYYGHGLVLNPAEERLREKLVPQLPEEVIDVHVHASDDDHYLPDDMPESVTSHMMSTFPVTTLDQSASFDDVLMPGIDVRKVRFAHAYAGIDHFKVTDYLIDESPDNDAVFAFGRSDTEEEINRTILDIQKDRVAGLKMYYLANGQAKSDLYDYFPPRILAAAEEAGTPIMLHLPHSLYNSQEEVIDLAQKYPNLDIILAHMGVAHVPKDSLPTILGRFSVMPNIYVDTSQVHDTELIRSAIVNLGVERVLFGTDEPLNLLRSVVYDNPRLGPRILTDYPYHWVDRGEYDEFINEVDGEFIHSHWQQLRAILQAIKIAFDSEAEQQQAKVDIFHDNSQKLLNMQ
jgi:predicted TIM-barrel fold metal-dependent hydrolase